MTINIGNFADLDGIGDYLVDSNKHLIGLEDIDQSKFDDDEAAGSNLLVHVRDDGEADMPSIKHGLPLLVAVYVTAVFVALGLVAMIFYCSRNQERTKSKKEAVKKEEKSQAFRSSISCRPWSNDADAWGDKTAFMSEAGSENGGCSTDDNSSTDCDDMEEAVIVDHRRHTHDCLTMDGPTDDDETAACCRLCNEPFEFGQPVYDSNNPQCGHQFHKVCLDRWLDVQNTCPTCNQPYVLHTTV
ncbi:finger protein [Seminavis robusta]|uniref:Finger protein n=1 Tax=Seminavis robusta TaxID=568900 RepID=A0A9N8EQM5_9STRA|nr:finger protein [Seminavis robusta]|eukprot:Sro1355_g265590.1 finger protein (243) ;mRNA; f:24771-25499